jgi:DNA invertase Pin-like site-specific DNA recombinase
LEVHAEYIDDNTAPGIMERPQLVEALRVIGELKEQAIFVTYSFSDWIIQTLDSLEVMNKIVAANSNLVSVREGINTSTTMGCAMMLLLQMFEQHRRATSGEGMSSKIRERIHKEHKNWFGNPRGIPYGLKEDPEDSKKLIDCPEEKEVIKKICAYYDSGSSAYFIARKLMADGIKRRNGRVVWDYGFIISILRIVGYPIEVVSRAKNNKSYMKKRR